MFKADRCTPVGGTRWSASERRTMVHNATLGPHLVRHAWLSAEVRCAKMISVKLWNARSHLARAIGKKLPEIFFLKIIIGRRGSDVDWFAES